MPRQENAPLELFLSHVPEDEALRAQFEEHLAVMVRDRKISVFHHGLVAAGEDARRVAAEHLESAKIIAVLVSSDYLASDYHVGTELQRALARQAAGDARLLPILVRACDWKDSPLQGLTMYPRDGKAVARQTSADDAFAPIAEELHAIVDGRPVPVERREPIERAPVETNGSPRSVGYPQDRAVGGPDGPTEPWVQWLQPAGIVLLIVGILVVLVAKGIWVNEKSGGPVGVAGAGGLMAGVILLVVRYVKTHRPKDG